MSAQLDQAARRAATSCRWITDDTAERSPQRRPQDGASSRLPATATPSHAACHKKSAGWRATPLTSQPQSSPPATAATHCRPPAPAISAKIYTTMTAAVAITRRVNAPPLPLPLLHHAARRQMRHPLPLLHPPRSPLPRSHHRRLAHPSSIHPARRIASPHQLAEFITALRNAGLPIHFAHQAKPLSAVNGYCFPQRGAVYQAETHRNNRLWAERYDTATPPSAKPATTSATPCATPSPDTRLNCADAAKPRSYRCSGRACTLSCGRTGSLYLNIPVFLYMPPIRPSPAIFVMRRRTIPVLAQA